jgi:hypothetical protein
LAKVEAERLAKVEAERLAKVEAERLAKVEAERQAKVEAERQAKVEAERLAKVEAERLAKEEAERQARQKAERRAQEEAERQALQEAERRAQEEARWKARQEDQARSTPESETEEPAVASPVSPLEETATRLVPGGASIPPARTAPDAPPPAEAVVPPPAARGGEAAEETPERGSRVAAFMVMVLLLGLAGGGWFGLQWWRSRQAPPNPVVGSLGEEALRKRYTEKGWEADAYEVLSQFIAARTPAGKAACVIGGEQRIDEMEKFYRLFSIDDSGTPAGQFMVRSLATDRQRGIFQMVYEQPPALDPGVMFTPIVPLAVHYGLEEPDLIQKAMAKLDNFTSEPLNVQVFFKQTPQGLRLDWDTFVQTRHRTLREFLDLPVDGRTAVFRVVIQETTPDMESGSEGMRTYLIEDPAYREVDFARIDVRVDSDVGKALSVLNWRKVPGARIEARTATVELRCKRAQTREFEISRFLCWEFLGVGGEVSQESK